MAISTMLQAMGSVGSTNRGCIVLPRSFTVQHDSHSHLSPWCCAEYTVNKLVKSKQSLMFVLAKVLFICLCCQNQCVIDYFCTHTVEG